MGTSQPGIRHLAIDPAILCFGTPVVLVSTVNPDGSDNVMPMSSAFWLSRRGILGISSRAQTAKNLTSSGECVPNLPSVDLVSHVDRLALTTGANPVPADKAEAGYRFVSDKFAHAGLTPLQPDTAAAARIAECPARLEARLVDAHPRERVDPENAGSSTLFEVKVLKIHVHQGIRLSGTERRIDPDRWRPLIMSFQQFYGLVRVLHASPASTRSGIGELAGVVRRVLGRTHAG